MLWLSWLWLWPCGVVPCGVVVVVAVVVVWSWWRVFLPGCVCDYPRLWGCGCGCVWVGFFHGEFDPGSGRTLAACLTHASRAERPFRGYSSGERVSNTWVTCLRLWDNSGKPGLILDRTDPCMGVGGKIFW